MRHACRAKARTVGRGPVQSREAREVAGRTSADADIGSRERPGLGRRIVAVEAVGETTREIELQRALAGEDLGRALCRRNVPKADVRSGPRRGGQQRPPGVRGQVEPNADLNAGGNEAPRVQRDTLHTQAVAGRRGARHRACIEPRAVRRAGATCGTTCPDRKPAGAGRWCPSSTRTRDRAPEEAHADGPGVLERRANGSPGASRHVLACRGLGAAVTLSRDDAGVVGRCLPGTDRLRSGQKGQSAHDGEERHSRSSMHVASSEVTGGPAAYRQPAQLYGGNAIKARPAPAAREKRG